MPHGTHEGGELPDLLAAVRRVNEARADSLLMRGRRIRGTSKSGFQNVRKQAEARRGKLERLREYVAADAAVAELDGDGPRKHVTSAL